MPRVARLQLSTAGVRDSADTRDVRCKPVRRATEPNNLWRIDTNGDGTIDKTELANFFSSLSSTSGMASAATAAAPVDTSSFRSHRSVADAMPVALSYTSLQLCRARLDADGVAQGTIAPAHGRRQRVSTLPCEVR